MAIPNGRLAGALILFCTAVAPAQVNYRDPSFEVQSSLDIPYGTGRVRGIERNKTLLLDLYEPRDGGSLANRPGVVLIHGGSFVSGNKSESTLVRLCGDLAARGFVAVSINYRLEGDDPDTPGDTPRSRAVYAAVEDAITAVTWMTNNARSLRVDASRIAIGGSSAGAIASLTAAYYASWRSPIRAVIDLWGRLGELASLGPGDPPLMIIHGTEDQLVSADRALELAARANEVSVPVELNLMEGLGHGFSLSQPSGGSSLTARIADFLAFHMRLGQYAEPAAMSIVCTANYQRVIAAGAIASVFGMGLASEQESSPVPRETLAGVSVAFRDSQGAAMSAKLFHASPYQIDLVMPHVTGPQTMVISSPAREQTRFVEVRPTAPAIFSANGRGNGVAAAYITRLRSSGETYVEPVFECHAGACSTSAVPLPAVGETTVLTLFATGIRNHGDLDRVAVRVGGVRLPILYAGPQPETDGLDQINVALPEGFGMHGVLSVLVSVENEASNVVTVEFQ